MIDCHQLWTSTLLCVLSCAARIHVCLSDLSDKHSRAAIADASCRQPAAIAMTEQDNKFKSPNATVAAPAAMTPADTSHAQCPNLSSALNSTPTHLSLPLIRAFLREHTETDEDEAAAPSPQISGQRPLESIWEQLGMESLILNTQ